VQLGQVQNFGAMTEAILKVHRRPQLVSKQENEQKEQNEVQKRGTTDYQSDHKSQKH